MYCRHCKGKGYFITREGDWEACQCQDDKEPEEITNENTIGELHNRTGKGDTKEVQPEKEQSE